MNRRGFLGTLIGIAIAPVASALPPIQWARTGFVPISEYGYKGYEIGAARAGLLNDSWICIVHPDCERDIRNMVAKEKWRNASRQARVDKFTGSPQEILARYKPALMRGEEGKIYGVKLISIASVK